MPRMMPVMNNIPAAKDNPRSPPYRNSEINNNTQGTSDQQNHTPTTDSRHIQASKQNFSLRQSQESVKTPVQGGSRHPNSKTIRLMQKSVESRDANRKATEASSKSRERLLWTQHNDQKVLATSKTIKYENPNNQIRMSTESHVSGISGILGTTQLTAMGQSAISQNNNLQRSHKKQERLSDEILIGCQVLQEPKHVLSVDQNSIRENNNSAFQFSNKQQMSLDQAALPVSKQQRSNTSNNSFYEHFKSPFMASNMN